MSVPENESVSIPLEVASFYAQGKEADRLFQGRGRLELDRTQEILRRHLPPPPAVILDVGGATGVYACWLADLGYDVHLIDPVPSLVEAARLASARQPSRPLASAQIGDARRLEWPARSADAVLLMGPLYHLTERSDRLQALNEARRVLRPGGILFAVGISRYASLMDGLFHGFHQDAAYVRMVDHALRDGVHSNPPERGYFTTAYLHRPEELEAEVRSAGFVAGELLAIESVAAFLPDFDAWWNEPQRREQLLTVIRTVEGDWSFMGASSHLMMVARKRRRRLARKPSASRSRGAPYPSPGERRRLISDRP